jgi:hypothetical protein
MEELIQLVVKSYGIIGIILLTPFIALKFLWSEYQKLRKDLAVANDKVVEAQKQRVEDAKAISEKLIEMSSEHASLTKETNHALEQVGDTLTVIVNSGGSIRRRRLEDDDGHR